MSHAPGVTLKPMVSLGREPRDCWSWIGSVDEGGYGRKQFGNKTMLAHRWLWQQLFGAIPDGLVVGHKCDNRACVNPHHLQVVTQAESCRRGVTASLMPADIIEIRRARKNRTPNMRQHLADHYGVAPSTISDIWGRKSWRKPQPFYGAKKNAPKEEEA